MMRPTTKQSKPKFKFATEIIAELKKAVWLTRREVIYLSFLVLLLSLAMGLFLGTADFGFTNLVTKLLLGR